MRRPFVAGRHGSVWDQSTFHAQAIAHTTRFVYAPTWVTLGWGGRGCCGRWWGDRDFWKGHVTLYIERLHCKKPGQHIHYSHRPQSRNYFGSRISGKEACHQRLWCLIAFALNPLTYPRVPYAAVLRDAKGSMVLNAPVAQKKMGTYSSVFLFKPLLNKVMAFSQAAFSTA